MRGYVTLVSGSRVPDGTLLCGNYACSAQSRRDPELGLYQEEWMKLFMNGADMKDLLSAESKTKLECTDCSKAKQKRTRVLYLL